MKSVISCVLLLSSIASYSQKFTISVEQAGGISCLTRQVLPFEPIFSYQSTFTMDLYLNASVSVGTGAGFQHAGSSSELMLTNINGNVIGTVRNYELFDFIKIPVEIRYASDGRFRYIGGIGGFYNILRKHLTTNNNENVVPIAVLAADYLPANHAGIRFRQGVDLPFGDKFSLEFSVLEEYGFKRDPQPVSLWNIYITAAFRYKP